MSKEIKIFKDQEEMIEFIKDLPFGEKEKIVLSCTVEGETLSDEIVIAILSTFKTQESAKDVAKYISNGKYKLSEPIGEEDSLIENINIPKNLKDRKSVV